MSYRTVLLFLAVSLSSDRLFCRSAEAEPQPQPASQSGGGGRADAGGARLPVRIAEGAGLGANTDVDAALHQSTTALDVLVGKPRKGPRQKVQLRSCLDYLRIARQDIETEDPVEERGLLWMEARCQALGMIREAVPSERSFLDGFTMDAGSPTVLPAALYLDLSPGETRRLRAAAREGHSWSSFDPKLRARRGDRGALSVTGDGYEAEVVEYARADFNHDGVEDILVLRTGFPIGGTMVDYTVFLLGRKSETAALAVLKTWRRAY